MLRALSPPVQLRQDTVRPTQLHYQQFDAVEVQVHDSQSPTRPGNVSESYANMKMSRSHDLDVSRGLNNEDSPIQIQESILHAHHDQKDVGQVEETSRNEEEDTEISKKEAAVTKSTSRNSKPMNNTASEFDHPRSPTPHTNGVSNVGRSLRSRQTAKQRLEAKKKAEGTAPSSQFKDTRLGNPSSIPPQRAKGKLQRPSKAKIAFEPKGKATSDPIELQSGPSEPAPASKLVSAARKFTRKSLEDISSTNSLAKTSAPTVSDNGARHKTPLDHQQGQNNKLPQHPRKARPKDAQKASNLNGKLDFQTRKSRDVYSKAAVIEQSQTHVQQTGASLKSGRSKLNPEPHSGKQAAQDSTRKRLSIIHFGRDGPLNQGFVTFDGRASNHHKPRGRLIDDLQDSSNVDVPVDSSNQVASKPKEQDANPHVRAETDTPADRLVSKRTGQDFQPAAVSEALDSSEEHFNYEPPSSPLQSRSKFAISASKVPHAAMTATTASREPGRAKTKAFPLMKTTFSKRNLTDESADSILPQAKRSKLDNAASRSHLFTVPTQAREGSDMDMIDSAIDLNDITLLPDPEQCLRSNRKPRPAPPNEPSRAITGKATLNDVAKANARMQQRLTEIDPFSSPSTPSCIQTPLFIRLSGLVSREERQSVHTDRVVNNNLRHTAEEDVAFLKSLRPELNNGLKPDQGYHEGAAQQPPWLQNLSAEIQAVYIALQGANKRIVLELSKMQTIVRDSANQHCARAAPPEATGSQEIRT